ncbi:helix-turn-helix transcriptional regulator [Catellatospora vulcania]|uniref:helix-turn-helix transcriptional regulator n=1 Tax=Catellatospora vulcania TaxID=1460450 RepID=UPI0018AF8238|nr:helix-turn-helix transcriptional regulator [Catellatospora vulcania]
MSPHADLVYRTLTAFGPWSVDRISRSLEMKTRLVRVALDELTALGAAVPTRNAADGTAGDDRIWAGRAPAQVLSLLRDRHQHHALARHRLQQRLTRMTYPSVVGDLSDLPATEARQVHGMARTIGRLAELTLLERHEFLSISPDVAYSAEAVKAAAPQHRKMIARGVQIRSLGVPAAPEDESAWHLEEQRSYGAQYRELPQLPGRVMISDRRTAIVPLDPSDRSRGVWEISAPDVVAELTALFFQLWGRAKDPGRDWTPPLHLAPRESAIVALLAAGHTDASIAAKLDISVRTIAYTLSALMDRYAVSSRFQLGLRLGAEATQQTAAGEPDEHEPDQE